MLQINPGLILWTIITFIVLLFLLRRFAWKPLLEALHTREESIRSSIEKSEQAKAEAERLLEENKLQLAGAASEVRRLIKEGEVNAERRRTEIEHEARQKAERRLKKLRRRSFGLKKKPSYNFAARLQILPFLLRVKFSMRRSMRKGTRKLSMQHLQNSLKIKGYNL